MSQRLSTWLERTSYIAVIGCSLTIATAVVRDSRMKAVGSSADQKTSKLEGTRLTIKGVNWKSSSQTLVLALSTSCHFCSESIPFYKRLVDFEQRRGLAVIAVVPQPATEANKYFATKQLKLSNIYSADLETLNVEGTPTLLLVNRDGIVEHSWVGALRKQAEESVLAQLRTP